MDRAELRLYLDDAEREAAAGNVALARYCLACADALLAAEEQRLATEPKVSPAPGYPPSPATGADSEGEATLPASPSRWCLKCGNELTALEEELCWRCVPRGDAP